MGSDYVPDMSQCFNGVQTNNGVLEFDSRQSFQGCIDCLDSKTDKMMIDFLDDWGSLSDSLLNEKTEEIDFRATLVYEAFEDHFDFSSLRRSVEIEDEDWLSNLPLDTVNIPGHIIGYESVLTLLNPDGGFSVDDTLSIIDENGDLYLILNSDFTVYDSIINGTWSGKNSNVELHYADGTISRSYCKATRSSGWKQKKSGSHMIKYVGAFYNLYFDRRWYATTKAYRKFVVYQPWITNISAAYGSYFYWKNSEGGCGYGPHWTDKDVQKRQFQVTSTYGNYHQPFRFASGDHGCAHSSQHVSVATHSVSW